MNSLHKLFLSALVLAAISGTIITVTAKESHEAMIQVMVKRAQLERANGASEDSKNRWVWVRDGLELKNHFMSDEVLTRIKATAEVSADLSLAKFRKTINVHYSGGDDNLYTIRVKHSRAQDAIAFANAYINEFAPLVLDAKAEALAASIRTIESEFAVAKDEATKARRAETLETLRSDLAFAKAENTNRIVVISKAHEARQIWPRPIFIFAASALIAIFLASLAAVAFKFVRN